MNARSMRSPSWCIRGKPGEVLMLMPGELYFGSAAASVRTLLGSCVAITVWHPRLRLGGMCHYLLPARNRRPGEACDGRFGDEAMATMVEYIHQSGTEPSEYQAHLHGGADTMPGGGTHFAIGPRNIEQGWNLLDRHGFSVDGVDVGEDIPRTVTLRLSDGHVALRRCVGSRDLSVGRVEYLQES